MLLAVKDGAGETDVPRRFGISLVMQAANLTLRANSLLCGGGWDQKSPRPCHLLVWALCGRELLSSGVGKGHEGGGMHALYTHKGHPKLAQPNQRCFLLCNHVPEFLLLQVGTFFVSRRRAGAFTRGNLGWLLS